MSTVIWFQCLFFAISAALVMLLIYEVVSLVQQGKPWRTPFIGGFVAVVVMTIILQWVIWDLMMNPLSLALPAVYCAAFAMWSASITWWIFIVLKEASTRSAPPVQGETELALVASLSTLAGAMLVRDGFEEALMTGMLPGDVDASPYDTLTIEMAKEVSDEQY